MILLIDIGNTRLKWAVLEDEDGVLTPGQALNNKQINGEALVESWKMLPTPVRLVLACVGSVPVLSQVQAVAAELWPSISMVSVSSQAHAFGVHNAYLHPETLGVDRWLGLVAVRNHHALPACVVGCGTAITVDLIDLDGKHQGGMICPGLTLMKKSLAAGTEALHFDETEYDVGPANFTQAAIYSGTLSAAAGLIEYVMSKQANSMQLILTGGDAELIAAHLETKAIIVPDLVLRGLAIVAENRL